MTRPIRTFVCHGAQTLELYEGDAVTAGRSSKCAIVLDDDLASRQHCRVVLMGGRVYVDDLDSRNGVLVNGLEIRGRHELHHGDQITVGRSFITLLRQGREPRTLAPSGSYDTVDEARHPPVEEVADQVTEAGELVEILAGSARRALSEGELMVAERTTLNLFGLLRRAARGRRVRADEVDVADSLALELASRTDDPSWLGRVLELAVATERTVGLTNGARFVELAESLGPPDRAVSDYLSLVDSLGAQDDVAQLCVRLVRDAKT